jgi:hypothetical protein
MQKNIDTPSLDRFKLRLAVIDDIKMYYKWVNDTEVRKQSFNRGQVLLDSHQKWFQQKLHDENCLLLVMEMDCIPVGQIRFDFKGGVAHIDYSLDKKARGKNWGKILLNKGENKHITFHADVKQQNPSSAMVFIKQGFTEMDSDDAEVRIFEMSSTIHTIESMTQRNPK